MIGILLLVLPTLVTAALTGPRIFDVAIIIGSNAPVVFNVTGGSVTPIENSTVEAIVYFNVTDEDGAADIVDNTAIVNASLGGVVSTVFRFNDSGNCENYASTTDSKAYSCIIVFNYYDNASTTELSWELNASVTDQQSLSGYNNSYHDGEGGPANITLQSLSAFRILQKAIQVSAAVDEQNAELTFDFNNTGNFDFEQLNLTPFDLNASLTDYFRLAGNFSINGTQSGAGIGIPLFSGVPTDINDTTGRINLTHRTFTGTGGTRTVYIYVDVPSADEITPGATYNTTSGTEWQAFAE